jgi:probable HAF family extracellular repeat protein
VPQVQPLEDRWLLSTIIDLGDVSPTALNASGQVAGDVRVGGNTHAFLYSNGTLTDLGTVAGFRNSYAYALNDNGKVVGSLINQGIGSVEEHAMFYNGQTMSDRGTAPGYTNGSATGLNDFGQAIGNANMGSGSTDHGLLYTYSDNTFTDTGISDVDGLNASGEVVGGNFLYTGGQTYYIAPGYNPARALSINASGQIAGQHQLGIHTAFDPFLWTPTVPNGTSGTLTDLGYLPGDQYGTAYGLNDAGEVVGSSLGTASHAFLYSQGTLMNLTDLLPAGSGWQLTQATAINGADQIVGLGLLNGVSHGFLLDLNAAPATHAAGVVAADAAAFTQAAAFAAPRAGTAPDQTPLAASTDLRDQPPTVAAAPAFPRVVPVTDSPVAGPASATPTALDPVSTAALDVPL